MEAYLPSMLREEIGTRTLPASLSEVGTFNTESETSHTARGSSDSRTGYDGGPLDRAISGPAWTPSSSQETWAPQPDSNCGGRGSTRPPSRPPSRRRRADPVSSAVHRLAGQLVERGVPSRVAL